MSNSIRPDKDDELIADLDADVERELAKATGDDSVEQLMEQAATPPMESTGASELSAGGDAPAPRADDTSKTDASEANSKRTSESGDVEFGLKRGRIARVQNDDVFVDLMGPDGKLQGVVPLKQFDRPPRIGSIMDFVLDRIDEAEGLVFLSREGAISVLAWDQLVRGTHVEARVVATNKGGLELEMAGSIRAFMPASQIDIRHVNELEPFVGQKLSAAVQEVDRRGKRVLLSRRRFLERQRAIKRETLLKELEVDQVREGTVTSVVPYGAFVDLGGIDGLIHISDMSYERVDKPQDVLAPDQHVTVKVLKIDQGGERIRLGLKQIEPDPWDGVTDRYKKGDQVSARIVRLADFGAFVELEAGIEALLPLSEMSWKRIGKPDHVGKVGDVLKLAILQIDPGKRRMSMSLKQVQGDPWQDAQEKYPKNALVEGTVVRTTEFGAFVEVETGLEGLAHISELADRHVKSCDEIVKVGQPYQFRVLDINLTERRLSLSIKAVAESIAEGRTATAPDSTQDHTARKATKRTRPLKGGMGQQGGMGLGLKDLKL